MPSIPAPRILVVDDEPGIRFALRAVLNEDGFEVLEAKDGIQALEQVDAHSDIALVITDLSMPGMDGMALLAELTGRQGAPPAIMITARGSERTAVEAIKRGALDYFAKPFEADEILRVVNRSIHASKLASENRRLHAEGALRRTMQFESAGMSRVAQIVERIARRDVSVLITGESGTGKELVAQAIVEASARAEGPFVKFNCGALPVDLAEAELFGHTKGAFTGADTARAGLFREAHGGTILLDEVGEFHPRTQAALLRVLQERRLRPVGQDKDVEIDVRILAATHKDLENGPGFRSDLYYRLNVVRVHVPPLRERKEDIVPLAKSFTRQACERFGIETCTLSASVLAELASRPWPGNVRELLHTIERLVALSDEPVIDTAVLRLADQRPEPVKSTSGSLKAQTEAFERSLIIETLERCAGNQSEAARSLECGRVTLISKMKKYGLQGSEYR